MVSDLRDWIPRRGSTAACGKDEAHDYKRQHGINRPNHHATA
jgi:hypothetical protein